jgi:ligand-binding sensor protein
MELTDVLSKTEWAAFEKELFDRYHINCTVYNASGIGVTGQPNWCNRLCPQIKANKDSLAAICAPGNQNFMAQAKKTRKAVIGECDAGLIKIAVPIFFNNAFLGTAGGCGLLPEGGAVETFIIEKTLGLSKEEIAALCGGIQSMSAEVARDLADFIKDRIDQYMDEYAQKLCAHKDREMNDPMQKVQKFIAGWTEDLLNLKPVFLSLLDDLKQKSSVVIEFHERPGITYSLRGIHQDQKDRPLFVMIDVIDDDPKVRWLSVCFFGDTIEDPDEHGDLIPGGLLGSDGYCFDITESNEPLEQYIGQRIQEAYKHACTAENKRGS